MNDDPNIAEQDQLAAHLRDVLEANGVELLSQDRPQFEWIRAHTATDLLEAMLVTAEAAGVHGALSAVVATRVGGGDQLGWSFVVVRRKAEREGEST